MRVALFITCLADTLFPEVGRATVRVLEGLGVEVEFPRGQTCCGQLHWNAGYAAEARTLGDRFERVFSPYEAVVTPSASCAGHVRSHVAGSAAQRTWELSEFLVKRMGIEAVASGFSGRVTFHPTCHSLRVLRLGTPPLRLLHAVPGVELVPLPAAEECCGFGGTFAVKNADVSTAMLEEKLANVAATGAEAVCACDASCLMHIGGGLRRRGAAVRAVHLAEILAA
jgi:L-lactate dehydrogenase complex protein LldE